MNIDIIHNRYELKQRLGTGAMGTVYRAYDRLTGDEVAVKLVIQSQDTNIDSTTANLALAHEFQVLASLRHPHIISVLDYGFYNPTTPYFTMAFLFQAQNLRSATLDFDLKKKALLLLQLLTGLVYLERRDIVHRDLKPDNILVTSEDQVKVVDFGLARGHQQMDDDEIGGTLAYIAPEIFYGSPPNHASDLYAVGVIAYEIFSHRPVYAGTDNVNEFIQHIISVPPDFKPFLHQVMKTMQHGDGEATPSSASFSTQMFNLAEMSKTTSVSLTDETRTFPAEEVMSDPQPNAHTQVAAYQQGTQPFIATPTELGDDPTPPELIEGDEPAFKLARVVQKLLAKKPHHRYQRAEDVIEDLCQALELPPPPQTSDIRESFLQTARFVGREAEFQQLVKGLEAMLQHQGSLFFIGGESGVGKSRLIAELRHLALVKGVMVLTGQSVREGSLPYQPWREVIRRLMLCSPVTSEDAQSLKPIVSDIERLLGRAVSDHKQDENAVQRTINAILSLFRSYSEPILLILEDWQWAQAESRDVLKRLSHYALGAPLLIVVSYRNDEAPALPDEYAGSTTVLLERLSQTAVEELTTSILGQQPTRPEFIKTLHRHTEGNVFFLIEAIRVLAEEAGSLEKVIQMTLPESLITGGISQVMQRRLDKLAAHYHPLLETAAAAGRELNLKLLRELNRGSRIDFEDWLTSTVNASIVEYRDEVWRFSHDKLRQHVLNQIDAPRQKLLHRQIAESLERLYPPEEQAAALVLHWNAAEDAAKVMFYTRIAGEQATRYNAYEEARQLYERALSLTTEPLLVMEFNNLLGGVCEYLSQYERAIECLNIALKLAQDLNQPITRAEAEHKLAWISMRQGDMVEAHRHATEALTFARSSQHTLLTVRALNALGVIYVVQGDNVQSREHLEQTLPLVQSLNNDYLHATILNTLGAAYEGEGRVDDAITTLKQAGNMAEMLRDRELLANVHGNLGRILYIQKHSVQAEASFLLALPGFREVGNLYGVALVNDYMGLIAAGRYDLKTARDFLYEGIRTSLTIGAQTVTLLGLCGLAQIYAHDKNETRAAELIGLIRAHPASAGDIDVQREAQTVLNDINLSESELEAAMRVGRTLDFEQTIAQELQISPQ